ncbi:MAG: glycosyltransferase, partial [Thermocrispum sp.]
MSEGEAAPHRAPVLAVLVCHDGEAWLPLALAALQRSSVRPARIVAVDTGSGDRTPELLTEAAESATPIIDAALTVGRDTGFAAAVAAGVRLAEE